MTSTPEPTPEETRAELDAELAAMRAKHAEREAVEGQSWDDFWREVSGPARTETIRGVTVQVPRDLPLRFDYRAEALSGSSNQEDHKALLTDLFGADVLDAWINAGMGAIEFQVVLYWGMSHGKGRPITFREAYDDVRAMEQGKAGVATQDGDESDATGEPSKPISAASTASRRRKSLT